MRTPSIAATCAAALALAGAAPPAVAGSPATNPGTIAYLQGRGEIHVIDPDGSNDRLVFRVPEGTVYGIQDVAWRPDGQQLAFSSGHEALCSVWQYDLYLVDVDGTNLERLTNGPACGELAGLPTGSVAITLENYLEDTNQFFVYAQGSSGAQLVTLEPGFRQTLTISGVADLGDGQPQYVVAFNADQRWFDAAVYADVASDATIDAGTLRLDTNSFDTWGALSVSWSAEGDRIAYQLGQGALWQVPTDNPVLSIGGTLLGADVNSSVLGTEPAWSPVDDRILYQNFSGSPTINVVTVGAADAGVPLAEATLVNGIGWFADGSGFIASDSATLLDSADLYLYDFSTQDAGRLTSGDGFAVWPSVSPDGASVAYTYSELPLSEATTSELRIRDIATGDERVLVENGLDPDWR